jgi:ABC-type transport system substrate-binding protein
MKRPFASFLSFLKTNRFPCKEDREVLRGAPLSFLKGVFIIVAIISIVLFLTILMRLSALVSTDVADYGGSITVGVIGAPRFINPLLATTETDILLSTLIYNPLVKETDDGTINPVLAKECTSNPDGTSYQCTLRENLVFSNNHPLTSADVVFTFQTKKALSLLHDPANDWGSITIEAPDEQTVRISTTGEATALKQKLTLGIIPKELWEPIPLSSLSDSAANMAPIGAGPFILSRISYTNTIPTEVAVKRNARVVKPKPFLKKIIVHSYANQLDLKAALHAHDVDHTSVLIGTYIDTPIQNNFSITTVPTNTSVALFMNQNQSGTPTARSLLALSPSIDRSTIIDTIEHGYGTPLTSESTPRSEVPPLVEGTTPLSIAVQKDEDLVKTAQLLSDTLKKFGILSTVNVFDQGVYTDQLQLKAYSFVLATNDTIAGYQRLIPLYTKSVPHIFAPTIHTPLPKTVRAVTESFRDATYWYARTDRVWNWFIHN